MNSSESPPITISVITVCFNAESTIEKTIRSVCDQVGASIQYIVVDGVSTDRTLDVVRKYSSRVDIQVSEKDAGIYDAMNKGIALATGDVVYFLNADDSFTDPYVLRDVAAAFAADPQRIAVYGNVILQGEPAGFSFIQAKAFETHSYHEILHGSFCHQAFFARRSLFDSLGMFDLQYRFVADYDFMLRAFKSNPRGFYFLDRKIAYYFYNGRSRQYDHVTRKEKSHSQFRHLMSAQLLWYHFRYVLVRGWKKRLLREAL